MQTNATLQFTYTLQPSPVITHQCDGSWAVKQVCSLIIHLWLEISADVCLGDFTALRKSISCFNFTAGLLFLPICWLRNNVLFPWQQCPVSLAFRSVAVVTWRGRLSPTLADAWIQIKSDFPFYLRVHGHWEFQGDQLLLFRIAVVQCIAFLGNFGFD